ncbi:protein-tyrosine phosphatase-like protein [Chlamydoabsidia padenii]|nr:protein-tyrosine phosphatase-like protein [Chlamydoabsidia padenii]
MIPSPNYSTPSLPTQDLFPRRPLSANLSSTLAQRRRKNKNLSLCLLPSTLHPPPSPTLRYYPHGPVAILPGVYLGDEYNVNNQQQLQALNIQYILNVAAEVDPALNITMGYKKRAWHHHIVGNQDQGQQELQDAVMDVVRMRSGNVLVHCQCGLARSATVVIAYVMHTLGLSLYAALGYVKQYAPHINPNLSLMYQLREYESSRWRSLRE